ncbi:unnamed protein product [Mycena citricolor]|uniref:Uncharacterized protein n=1 Tax=Mycena citricolor TaxID=2018698 RepID=A0AAD2JYH5_9AGAR|nr:unnamed protein product [Mycena citricolor]
MCSLTSTRSKTECGYLSKDYAIYSCSHPATPTVKRWSSSAAYTEVMPLIVSAPPKMLRYFFHNGYRDIIQISLELPPTHTRFSRNMVDVVTTYEVSVEIPRTYPGQMLPTTDRREVLFKELEDLPERDLTTAAECSNGLFFIRPVKLIFEVMVRTDPMIILPGHYRKSFAWTFYREQDGQRRARNWSVSTTATLIDDSPVPLAPKVSCSHDGLRKRAKKIGRAARKLGPGSSATRSLKQKILRRIPCTEEWRWNREFAVKTGYHKPLPQNPRLTYQQALRLKRLEEPDYVPLSQRIARNHPLYIALYD